MRSCCDFFSVFVLVVVVFLSEQVVVTVPIMLTPYGSNLYAVTFHVAATYPWPYNDYHIVTNLSEVTWFIVTEARS